MYCLSKILHLNLVTHPLHFVIQSSRSPGLTSVRCMFSLMYTILRTFDTRWREVFILRFDHSWTGSVSIFLFVWNVISWNENYESQDFFYSNFETQGVWTFLLIFHEVVYYLELKPLSKLIHWADRKKNILLHKRRVLNMFFRECKTIGIVS